MLKKAHDVPAVPVASNVLDANGKLTPELVHFLRSLADLVRDITDIEVLARQSDWRPPTQAEITIDSDLLPIPDATVRLGAPGSRFLSEMLSSALGIGGASAPAYPLDLRDGTASQAHIASSDVDDGTWITSYASGGHPGSYLSAGCAFNGTNWVAKNSQASILALDPSGNFVLFYNTGLAIGAAFTPTAIFTVALPSIQASLAGVRPTFLFDQGTAARARLQQVTANPRLEILANLYYDGTNWNRDDTTQMGTGIGLVQNGQVVFRYAAAGGGNPTSLTSPNPFAFDLTTGNLTISGTVTAGGVLLGGGAGGISVQNVVTASRAIGTNYRNTTGKPMFVVASIQTPANTTITALTDSAAAPTTTVMQATNTSAAAANATVAFWVLNNNYYRVANGTAVNIWTEWN